MAGLVELLVFLDEPGVGMVALVVTFEDFCCADAAGCLAREEDGTEAVTFRGVAILPFCECWEDAGALPFHRLSCFMRRLASSSAAVRLASAVRLSSRPEVSLNTIGVERWWWTGKTTYYAMLC